MYHQQKKNVSLREEIASLTGNLFTKSYEPSLLEPYIAARLIPHNENPGIRPIGIGESLRSSLVKQSPNISTMI